MKMASMLLILLSLGAKMYAKQTEEIPKIVLEKNVRKFEKRCTHECRLQKFLFQSERKEYVKNIEYKKLGK